MAKKLLSIVGIVALMVACSSGPDSESGGHLGFIGYDAGDTVTDPFFGILQANGITQSEIRIKWSIVNEEAVDMDWVSFEVKGQDDDDFHLSDVRLDKSVKTYVVPNLHVGENYRFRIVGRMSTGDYKTSSEFVGTTLQDGVLGFSPPENLQVTQDTHSATITWDYNFSQTLLDSVDQATGDYYFEVYKNNGQTLVGTTHDMQMVDDNLLPCEGYVYTVRFVFPGIGESPEASVESQSLGTANLDPVENFHATSGELYVTLNWNAQQSSPNSGYFYQIKMSSNGTIQNADDINGYLFNADHLDANASVFAYHTYAAGAYYFWIRVVKEGSCDYSPWTDRLTGLALPQSPQDCTEGSEQQSGTSNGIVTGGPCG